jgi:hypothetical protein
MKIIAKTEAAYKKNLREISDLFKKANPQADDFLRMIGHGISKYPPEYPNGVSLVLKKTCPYCMAEKEYNFMSWYRHNPHQHLSPDFGYLRAKKEIEELNPGICNECAYNTYQSSKQSSGNKKPHSKGGGFWDGFLEGLRGDK